MKPQPEEFDALMIPGGLMNPDELRATPDALEFTKHFFREGKPVAAICHAPWVLIDAGVARGRKLTSWEHIQTDVKNAGGNWINEEVVMENGLVTSRKPDDIPVQQEDDRRILRRETCQADAVCRGRPRDIIRGNSRSEPDWHDYSIHQELRR